MHVRVYVCKHLIVCVCACMHVCMHMSCMFVRMHVCICVSCIYIMYLCTYACMYICIMYIYHVCLYVCMYVYVCYVCTDTWYLRATNSAFQRWCARRMVLHLWVMYIFLFVCYICINTLAFMCMCIQISTTHCGDKYLKSSYRVAKTHRIPYLYRSFSAKEPYI